MAMPTPTPAKQRRLTLAWLTTLVILGAPAIQRAYAGQVAVVLSAKVPAYKEAVEGFCAAGRHQVTDTHDMSGNIDRGVQYVRAIDGDERSDLILAVGPFALQAVMRVRPTKSVVFTMVLNAPSIVGKEPGNITGASMNVSSDRIFQTLRQLAPNVRRIATIYNPDATGFLVEDAQRLAEELELTLVAREGKNAKQAIAAIRKLHAEPIDALWIVPDKVVLAPSVVKAMLRLALSKRVPVIGLSKRHAEMGSLMCMSFASSEDIGAQAGELAQRVLDDGVPPADLPFTTVRDTQLILNLKIARKLHIDVPDILLDRAKLIIK